MNLKLHVFQKVSIVAATCLCLNACAKETTAPVSSRKVGKIECVGRSQIELPGEVDFALSDIKKMIRGHENADGQFFSDGSRFYGHITFNDYLVTRIATESEYKKYIDLRVADAKESYAEALTRSEKKTDFPKYSPPEKMGSRSIVFRGPHSARLYAYRDGRIYGIGEEYDYSKTKTGEEIAATFVNFMPRKAYETPSEKGFCFPFGFMKDDGKAFYNVSVGMRLIDHPDVEITFHDRPASSEEHDRAEGKEYSGSRGNVQRFWSRYGPSDGNLLDGTINHYHDVDLSGYPGQYATATIGRPFSTPEKLGYDEPEEEYAARVKRGIVEKIYRMAADQPPAFETPKQRSARVKREILEGKYRLDYGYMAYYKGDPDKPGEPDLMLSVIRTASRAVEAGKTPVTQEELYAMAKKIAASIKRRPVQ